MGRYEKRKTITVESAFFPRGGKDRHEFDGRVVNLSKKKEKEREIPQNSLKSKSFPENAKGGRRSLCEKKEERDIP